MAFVEFEKLRNWKMDEKHLQKLLKKQRAKKEILKTESAELLNIPDFEKECRQGLKEIKRGKGKKINK
jgi:NCAIR mutase (PurE)-related protein